MSTSNASRHTVLISIAALLAIGMLAVVILAAFAVWRLTDWGSEAVNQATEAASAVVAPLREDAQRAVDDTKATVASSVAAVALTHEATRRAMADASSTVNQAKDRTAQALSEPEAIVRRLSDAAVQDASLAIAAAAAAVAPAVTGHLEAAQGLIPRGASHPTVWPEGLALKQVHYREVGDVTEYSYVAETPSFELQALREQLIGLRYAEHVLAEGEGMLEAVYRGERQLLLSVTARDGEQRIDIREMPRVVIDKAGS